MKKVILIVTVLAMLVSLCACASGGSETGSKKDTYATIFLTMEQAKHSKWVRSQQWLERINMHTIINMQVTR